MATILYARVSTADQHINIRRAHAERSGFEIDEVVADDGASGVSVPLRERPERRRLFELLRRDDTVVVRKVDLLGRCCNHVIENFRQFIQRSVVIKAIINCMVFDASTTHPCR